MMGWQRQVQITVEGSFLQESAERECCLLSGPICVITYATTSVESSRYLDDDHAKHEAGAGTHSSSCFSH